MDATTAIEQDRRLTEAVYVVEATSYEQLALWREFSAESAQHGWGTGTATWKQDNWGFLSEVGQLAGFPVVVCLTFARIYGRLVAFYESTSRVVDHQMVEEWMRAHVPAYDGHHTNAMNFGHCLSAVRK